MRPELFCLCAEWFVCGDVELRCNVRFPTSSCVRDTDTIVFLILRYLQASPSAPPVPPHHTRLPHQFPFSRRPTERPTDEFPAADQLLWTSGLPLLLTPPARHILCESPPRPFVLLASIAIMRSHATPSTTSFHLQFQRFFALSFVLLALFFATHRCDAPLALSSLLALHQRHLAAQPYNVCKHQLLQTAPDPHHVSTTLASSHYKCAISTITPSTTSQPVVVVRRPSLSPLRVRCSRQGRS